MSPDDPFRDELGGLEPARPVARPDRRRRGLLGDRQDDAALNVDDLERGRSAALLGALGRLQLRVDVLAKQQEQVLERLVTAVEALEARVARLDAAPAAAAPPAAGASPSAGAQPAAAPAVPPPTGH